VNTLDKNEYRVRLEEINTLVDNQNYEEALRIVETIDWRRVKNARTLCMIGEIYEANKMYEKSRQLLLMAYDRAPIGKTVLYHLVELAIKMGDLDDAVDYYHEFAMASPNDNNKYILKYKIYRARKSPIKDQIAILEEFKAREYTERWAYELARLYAKAGMREKCIEECDDLILWFAEGRFVTKAMELKMTYTSLTPSQKEKYQGHFQTAPAADIFPVREPAAAVSGEEKKPVQESGEEQPVQNPPREVVGDLQEKITQGLRDVFTGSEGQKAEENLTSAIKNMSVLQDPVVVPEAKQFVLPDEFKKEDTTNEKRLVPGEIDMADYDVDIDAIIGEHTRDLTYVARELAEEVPAEEEKKELSEEEAMQAELAAAVHAMMAGEENEEKSEEKPEEKPEEELSEEELLQKELAAAVHTMMAEDEMPQEEPEEASEEAEEEPKELKAEEVPVFSGPEKEHETEDLGITKAIDLEAQLVKAMEDAEKEAKETAASEGKTAAAAVPAKEPEQKLLRHHLTEKEQKSLLTYFAQIPGMREQLVELLDIIQESACEKTSRNGNFMVVGRPGTGKTHLSESIIKAICKERRMEAAKIAYIDGSDFNEKDPAAVVSKLFGGFLVIERAGDMNPETVHKLTQAMEFKTNGLIVVLEDEKQPMKELVSEYPKLAEKFGMTITVPVFTNDELVSFAKIYAHELGYHMDELGVLALYTLIGDNQKETEPVAVGQVKEIMDRAIYKSQKGGRKLGRKISNRLVDEQNRFILYEKDFDL
jgi:tetratricopeptide (TPR) repeat protein/Holliday junction resolvasome RuvABC ATP-dependent DNA helicase subunit